MVLEPDASSVRPHVVMFAGTMVSHAGPSLLLAKKLCAVGINISFINAESVISKLKATGDLGEDNGGFRVVAVPDGKRYKASNSFVELLEFAEESTKEAMEERLKGLMTSQVWATPCCAIIDIFVPWVVKITEPLHIKSYIMFTSTAAAISLVLHAPVLLAQGIIPVDHAQAHKLKPVEIPCIPPLHPVDFVAALQRRGILQSLFLETSKCILQVASGVFVNSLYELESSVFDGLNEYYHVGAPSSKLQKIIPVGPLLPDSVFTKAAPIEEPAAAVDEKYPVLDWLDKQPPSSVLYISFGTIAEVSVSQMIELGLGLEASDQRFIWVVRPVPDVAVSTFDNFLRGLKDRVEDRCVIVTTWAPQVHILQHPATGGFLTHCGWSSIVESISGNVPMLTWPVLAEQAMNSRWLVDVEGVALRLRNGFDAFVTRDEVEKAIRALMGSEKGQALRKNVMRLNEVIHEGVTESGSSFRNIKAFAEQLVQWNEETSVSRG